METFFSFLEKRVEDCSSLLCVGLDPHPSDLPAPTAGAARAFCLRLIEAAAPYAAAFKPNAAFFEAYGPEGWSVLEEIVAAIRRQSERLGSMIPVILDAKRGDIASSAEAYARSAFERLGVHAITLSPYLGRDSIEPFLTYREKGAFLLCKTSNASAGDLQDLELAPPPGTNQPAMRLYEYVARLVQSWNTGNNLGIVVGATQPESLARARAAAPDLWILAPGIGAQGGDLATALQAGLRKDGRGMLIPIARGISRADDPARAAAAIRDDILSIQYSRRGAP